MGQSKNCFSNGALYEAERDLAISAEVYPAAFPKSFLAKLWCRREANCAFISGHSFSCVVNNECPQHPSRTNGGFTLALRTRPHCEQMPTCYTQMRFNPHLRHFEEQRQDSASYAMEPQKMAVCSCSCSVRLRSSNKECTTLIIPQSRSSIYPPLDPHTGRDCTKS